MIIITEDPEIFDRLSALERDITYVMTMKVPLYKYPEYFQFMTEGRRLKRKQILGTITLADIDQYCNAGVTLLEVLEDNDEYARLDRWNGNEFSQFKQESDL